MAHSTLADNAVTNIDIGDVATHIGVIVKFACYRGTDYQAGQVSVLNETATADYNEDHFGTDIGLALTADISGADIRLVCTVDNSSANDVEFYYNITRIDL